MVEQDRFDLLEGRLGAGLDASQDVHHVFQVGQTSPGLEVMDLQTGREEVHDVLLQGQPVGHRGRQADGRLEGLLSPRRGDEGVQEQRDPAEVFFLELLDHGAAQAGPGAPVDVAQAVAGAELAGRDELGRLAHVRGQGDPSWLVAPPDGDVQVEQGMEGGVDQEAARLREPPGIPPQAPGKDVVLADSLQDQVPPPGEADRKREDPLLPG